MEAVQCPFCDKTNTVTDEDISDDGECICDHCDFPMTINKKDGQLIVEPYIHVERNSDNDPYYDY